MTPVPVVSTPLKTRTEREWAWDDGKSPYWQPFPMGRADLGRIFTRERLVADPAFVVLPEIPDLTCRECKGKGRKPGTPLSGFRPQLHCTSCGGTGVSPVYAATWQCDECRQGDGWVNDLALDVLAPCPRHERRQLVEWRARRVEPLPVFASGHPDEDTVRSYEIDEHGNVFDPDGWTVADDNGVTEPWAQNLQPGMCVLRLDGWEHLEQPHTEMVCPRCEGVGWIGPGMNAPICPDCGPKVWVPLSVPDGVLSWIELA